MQVKIVSSKSEMQQALNAAGLTPSPIPGSHTVEIGDLTIEREVRETSFYGCNHAVSTDRFSKEHDFCSVCNAMRTVR